MLCIFSITIYCFLIGCTMVSAKLVLVSLFVIFPYIKLFK